MRSDAGRGRPRALGSCGTNDARQSCRATRNYHNKGREYVRDCAVSGNRRRGLWARAAEPAPAFEQNSDDQEVDLRVVMVPILFVASSRVTSEPISSPDRAGQQCSRDKDCAYVSETPARRLGPASMTSPVDGHSLGAVLAINLRALRIDQARLNKRRNAAACSRPGGPAECVVPFDQARTEDPRNG